MSRKEETLSWKKFKSGSWLLSFIFSLTISGLLRDNVSSVAFGAISVYDFSEQSSEAAIRGIPKMSTHPHQAGVTHIPNSSPACQKLCLFTNISTFSPAFLPFHPHFYLFTHISSSLSLYVENFKQIISSHWSEVLCVLFKAWTNFASVLLSLFTQKRARSRISEVDFKQNYLNKNICLIGKLFDLTDCLVKNRFKFTGFSLLRKLAHMHAHHFLMDR